MTGVVYRVASSAPRIRSGSLEACIMADLLWYSVGRRWGSEYRADLITSGRSTRRGTRVERSDWSPASAFERCWLQSSCRASTSFRPHWRGSEYSWRARRARFANLRLSLVFTDSPSEKCSEKCCEFGGFGRQLPPAVTDLVKVESHFRLKPCHSHFAVP